MGILTGDSTGWLGGLVGVLRSGTISQSFATGSATVGYLGNAGGLVGEMDGGSIQQSYAMGRATAGNSADAGGLVAHSYGGSIDQTFAVGFVSAGPSFSVTGGLIAEAQNTTITNSYWDTDTSGHGAGQSAGGTGVPSSILKATLPPGFATPNWAPPPTPNPGLSYPILGWQPFLSFPFQSATPFSVEIVSVMDHSKTPLDPVSPVPHFYGRVFGNDSKVRAYTGELGSNESCAESAKGFTNFRGTPFQVNGRYTGTLSGCDAGALFLNYDGHSGYDYRAVGIPIYAPANGTLRKAVADSVNHSSQCQLNGWDEWHSFYIDHGNGYSSWYLHVEDLDDTGPGSVKNQVETQGFAIVTKGQVVARTGTFGPCGNPAGMPPHLHFEVRAGSSSVVDPYSAKLWSGRSAID